MALATQMNFRIGHDLKAAGNMALAESGVTPSDLVRATWEYLGRNRHTPDAVSKLLEFLRNDGRCGSENERADPKSADAQVASTASEAERIVMAGPNLIRQYFDELNLDPNALSPLNYDDMKLEAYVDKFPQIGSLS